LPEFRSQVHWLIWAERDTDQNPVARMAMRPDEVVLRLGRGEDFIAWPAQ
jgi:hypothetical protein